MKQNAKQNRELMKTFFTHWRQLLCCILLVLTACVTRAQQRIIGTTQSSTSAPTYGTIYSTGTDGSNFKTEYSFQKNKYSEAKPFAGLVELNGKLYGAATTATADDGTAIGGAIFSYDPVSKAYVAVYRFRDPANGNNPIYITQYNGKLYGITTAGGSSGSGVIFTIDPTKTGDDVYSKLCDFDGVNFIPAIAGSYDLVFINNNIYGLSDQGGSLGAGTIFKYDLSKTGNDGLSDIYDFDGGANGGGQYNGGGLTTYNGKLYGFSGGGGDFGQGVVFSFDPTKTGNDGFTKLYDFDGGANGGLPFGNFTVFNNKIYGMTFLGGASNNGTIFSVDPSQSGSSAVADAHDFEGGAGGASSQYLNQLLVYNNKLYGTTYQGGLNGHVGGLIFSFDPNQGFSQIGSLLFRGDFGDQILPYNNKIYITYPNSNNGKGYIASIDLANIDLTNDTQATEIDFGEALATRTPGSIITANGIVYGLEATASSWQMFSYNPSDQSFKDLATFDNTIGTNPVGNLVTRQGIVYGLTTLGGTNNHGTLFSYDTKADKFTVLTNFDATNGYGIGQLILSADKIYGSSSTGGANNLGTIVSYDITAQSFTKLADLTTQNNATLTGLTAINDNKLFGWGSPTGAGYNHYDGYLLSYDINSQNFNHIYDLPTGTGPANTVPNGTTAFLNNKIYGILRNPAQGGSEFFYSLDPATNNFTYKDITTYAYAQNSILVTSNNVIYGINTGDGGAPRFDLFKYDPNATEPFINFQDFGTGGIVPAGILVYNPPAVQTITFNDLPAKTYGDTDFAPGATSSNTTLPIIYKSDNATVATITAEGKIHIVGAGTVNITASQAGDDTYSDAADVAKLLTVNKAALTISAKDGVIVFGSAVPTTFEITYDKFVNGDTQAVLGGNVTATTTATSTSPSGQYPINVAGPTTNANYTIIYKPGKFIISDGTPVIAFGNNFPTTLTYGAQTFDPGATSSAGTNAVYTTSDANVATVTADNKIKVVGAGNVTITVNFAGGNSFNAGSATKTLTIAPAALTVTANDATRRYKSPDPVFSASYSGFVNGDNESKLATSPQFSTTASNTSLPAVYDINVCCAVSPNYSFTYVKGKLTVTGNQDVTFDALNSKIYGDAPFDPGATASSGLTPTYTSDNAGVAVIEAGKVKITGAGTANITANFPSQGDYLASNATQKLTVQPHQLTIIGDNLTKAQGQANPILTVTFNGFVNGDSYVSLTKQPDVNTTATTSSPVGTYPINVSNAQSYNGNYNIGYANGTLTVVAQRSLSFNTPPAKTYGQADFDSGISSSTQETIQYSSSDPTVAIINNGKIHIVGAGTTTLTATLPANGSYPTSTVASQLFTVNQAPLIVTANDVSKVYQQANPALTLNYQGFVNGETSAVLTSQPTATTSATTSSYPGSYTIYVNGGTAKNYTFSYVTGTLTVTPVTGADQNTMDAKMKSRSQLDVNLFLTTQQPANIMLYDIGGRLLNSQRPLLYKGFNTYTFDVSMLPVGTYIVKAVANNLNLSQKILVH